MTDTQVQEVESDDVTDDETVTADPVDNSALTLEDRVVLLEYMVSRILPSALAPRSSVVNPFDDADDPAMVPDPNDPTNLYKFTRGTWDDHEWAATAAKLRDSEG